MTSEVEETRHKWAVSYILLASGSFVFAGGLLLPWYSLEIGVFERLTGTLGAAYRLPTIALGAVTLVLGLLVRTGMGPRLWNLPLALTIAGAALAVGIFDVAVVMANLDHSRLPEAGNPLVDMRIGQGVWVALMGLAMQFTAGVLTWGFARTQRAERVVRARS
jgi:uncharacterized membrane protein YphA (DoxX/SURF4 family)